MEKRLVNIYSNEKPSLRRSNIARDISLLIARVFIAGEGHSRKRDTFPGIAYTSWEKINFSYFAFSGSVKSLEHVREILRRNLHN